MKTNHRNSFSIKSELQFQQERQKQILKNKSSKISKFEIL